MQPSKKYNNVYKSFRSASIISNNLSSTFGSCWVLVVHYCNLDQITHWWYKRFTNLLACWLYSTFSQLSQWPQFTSSSTIITINLITNLPIGQASHVLLSTASKTPLFHQETWPTIHGFSLAWASASLHPSLELK